MSYHTPRHLSLPYDGIHWHLQLGTLSTFSPLRYVQSRSLFWRTPGSASNIATQSMLETFRKTQQKPTHIRPPPTAAAATANKASDSTSNKVPTTNQCHTLQRQHNGTCRFSVTRKRKRGCLGMNSDLVATLSGSRPFWWCGGGGGGIQVVLTCACHHVTQRRRRLEQVDKFSSKRVKVDAVHVVKEDAHHNSWSWS